MAIRIVVFLLINFLALGLGSIFTSDGVTSEWYIGLNKAHWTPPGWVFGAAWTSIMICFAIYMAYLWPAIQDKKLVIGLFALQWILNILWNPVFFHFQNVAIGLVVITALTILVGYLLFYFYPTLKLISILIAPYFIWLIIATSLNAYILVNN